jgi:hypothetical protein
MIKPHSKHDTLAAVLIGFGIVLMFLAPSASPGIALMAAGIALEIVGVHMEHETGP